MPNEHIKNRVLAIQKALMAHHLGGKGLPNATIGDEREAFVKEFLTQVFPNNFRFGSGVITDAIGNLSGQCDIVIELPYELSFPMPGSSERLYPAEAVGAVIEVKSDLSAQWSQVETTVKKIRQLDRKLPTVMVMGSQPGRIPIFVAGYKGPKSYDDLKDRMEKTPDDSRPNGALVIESGCYFGDGGTADELGMLVFLAVIHNEMSRVVVATSNLGTYL